MLAGFMHGLRQRHIMALLAGADYPRITWGGTWASDPSHLVIVSRWFVVSRPSSVVNM